MEPVTATVATPSVKVVAKSSLTGKSRKSSGELSFKCSMATLMSPTALGQSVIPPSIRVKRTVTIVNEGSLPKSSNCTLLRSVSNALGGAGPSRRSVKVAELKVMVMAGSDEDMLRLQLVQVPGVLGINLTSAA